MNWSNFVYKIETDNSVRLRSSIVPLSVELSKNEYRAINENFDGKQLNEAFEELKRVGFIIDDLDQERDEYYDQLNQAYSESFDHFTLILTPTMKCNFNCSYCYENGSLREHDLTKGDIDKVFDWVTGYLILEKGINSLEVKLFGGEPLFVNREILQYLIDKVESLDIESYFGIITNGYLMDDEVCAMFKKSNLRYLQVTVDGSKAYHDMHKTLLNGEPTYNVIINNFEKALKYDISQVYIIRVNCSKSNIDEVPGLIRFIGEKFSEYKDHIIFSFGLIGKSYDDSTNIEVEESALNINDGSLSKYVNLYKISNDEGFDTPNYYTLSGLCSNKIREAVIVQSDGNITKCLRGIGREEFVESNISNFRLPSREPSFSHYDECFNESCPFIPYCNLGCQHNLFIESGEQWGRICNRETIEYVNKQLLNIMFE